MDRVGAAGDNAAMESFFALLQKNVLKSRRWATRNDLRLAIVTWIERTYHRRRRQRVLDKLTQSPRPSAVPTPLLMGMISPLSRRAMSAPIARMAVAGVDSSVCPRTLRPTQSDPA